MFQLQDLIQLWTMNADQFLQHKSIQSLVDYVPDYLSGPMNKDKDLNMALQKCARWCYLNKCNNNIYYEHSFSNIFNPNPDTWNLFCLCYFILFFKG